MAERITHNTSFDADQLVGRFDWTAELTAKMDTQDLKHCCHPAELEGYDAANQLTMRSPVSVIRPGGTTWTTQGAYCHLNVMQWSPFGPIRIVLPLTVLEGRHFYAFRREINDNRHLYLMEYGGANPLVAPEEAWLDKPIETLFQQQPNGKFERAEGERVEIILTRPAPLTQAKIDPIAHRYCRTRSCRTDLQHHQAVELLRKYFTDHPDSKLRSIADLHSPLDDV